MLTQINSPEVNAASSPPARLDIEALTASYGATVAVQDVSLAIPPHSVTAVIGPSGCGKSTFLRTLNRMHETASTARVSGTVQLNGVDLYGAEVDPTAVRRVIGMVFQRPNPFPTMSIYHNVIAGYTIAGVRKRSDELDHIVEEALRAVNLWDEVSHRLDDPGVALSGGQQQRLCIARAIAVQPAVLLMDEPCSALDPISTAAIEELIGQLKRTYTIVVVTHNMQQAARISDVTAFFNLCPDAGAGHLVEVGPTTALFSNPANAATQDYIWGRFG